jgi:hypothetical protein
MDLGNKILSKLGIRVPKSKAKSQKIRELRESLKSQESEELQKLQELRELEKSRKIQEWIKSHKKSYQETPFTIECQNLISGSRSHEGLIFTNIKQLCQKYINDPNYLFGFTNHELGTGISHDCLIVLGKTLSTSVFRDNYPHNNYDKLYAKYNAYQIDIIAIIKIENQHLLNSVILLDEQRRKIVLTTGQRVNVFKNCYHSIDPAFYNHIDPYVYNYTGRFRQFDENGHHHSLSREYKNGIIIRDTEWRIDSMTHDDLYPLGDTLYLWANTMKESYKTTWYSPGRKESEEKYINDKKSGTWTIWYPSGHKKSEENYINGKKSGICTYWDSDGRNFNEKHYHDDVMTNIVYSN